MSASKPTDEFWSGGMFSSPEGDGGIVADGFENAQFDFPQTMINDMFSNEEFRDGKEAFNGSMHDLQQPDADLERSGIRTSQKIRRPESMSMCSTGSDYVSADSFFGYRSDNPDQMGLAKHPSRLKKNVNNGHVSSGTGSADSSDDNLEKPDRSTLTQQDIDQLMQRERDEKRVRILSATSSEISGISSADRCSINTITCLEKVDELLEDDSSSDQEENSQNIRPPPKNKPRISKPAHFFNQITEKQRNSEYSSFPPTFQRTLPSQQGPAKNIRSPLKNTVTIINERIIRTADVTPVLQEVKQSLARISQRDRIAQLTAGHSGHPQARPEADSTLLIDSKAKQLLERSQKMVQRTQQVTVNEIRPQVTKERMEPERSPEKEVLKHADDVLARAAKRRSIPAKVVERKAVSEFGRNERIGSNVNRYQRDERNNDGSQSDRILMPSRGFQQISKTSGSSYLQDRSVSPSEPRSAPQLKPVGSKTQSVQTASTKNSQSQTDTINTSYPIEGESLSSDPYNSFARYPANAFRREVDFVPKSRSRNSSLLEQSTYPVPKSLHHGRMDIEIPSIKMYFPPAEIGFSSMGKCQVKNYGSIPFRLTLALPNGPFASRYDEIVIKERRYVSIPVRFAPTDVGYFRTKLLIVANPGRYEFEVELVGEGVAPTPRIDI